MKRTGITLLAVLMAVVSLHAFRIMQNSGIRGTILPADGATMVIATSATDTLKAVPGREGFFLHTAPGLWTVTIDAAAPYKDVTLQKVRVESGMVKDLGEIRLSQ